MDQISISTTPWQEPCIGIRDHDALNQMRIEAFAYIAQQKRAYGENPNTTEFKIKRNEACLGEFLEIHFCYDEDVTSEVQYATMVKSGCYNWDKDAGKQLRELGYSFPTSHSSVSEIKPADDFMKRLRDENQGLS